MAIKFLESGFDVWIGNNRGSIYSRFNEHLDSENNEASFYDYSFFEMGKFDLPAMINGILNTVSNHKKLTYVGYQQGNTEMFSALALNQGNLLKKVNFFIALAPVVRIDHVENKFIVALKNNTNIINESLNDMNINFLYGPSW